MFVSEKLHDSIKEKLDIVSDLYGFSVHINQTTVKIEFNGFVGLQLVFSIEKDNVDFRFWVRTSSWYYIDERTDIHDIINLVFAVLLKSKGISSSSIVHDLNSFGVPKSEIYSSFSVTTQSNFVPHKKNEFIDSLIDSVLFFQMWFGNSFGCPCEECNPNGELRIGDTVEISKRFKSNIFSVLGESININYKKRFYPSWEYFEISTKR